MDNVFDRIQSNTFDIITRTMGYNARWVTSGGSVVTWTDQSGKPQTIAKVLYNHPAEKTHVSDYDFETDAHSIEYRHGDFTGLKEAVKQSQRPNVELSIQGQWVRMRCDRVRSKFDGKTNEIEVTPL